ncbi:MULTISPECIES: hypothetical protein [Pseudonocardia]|uniref:Quinone oxidoreductase 2 n=2 Tax=Pseudonocardia TaxID=1847 RepID=A0A1Y2MZW7_PSEAH|nr:MULTISPECIES: hypothetical protein [Pseudonocardia]OSY40710.1 Quinone oxidoreductase 2 [Pseudonocardia autotrophica]TDN71983.1 hypothetical protein C8E95_1019 [Pseudonocardia autotrophica]BBG02670.1 hypothetical protein Pdca_38790 [Pseudonocardia autotrophica]GEC24729.1 hypothetical protein PSA01_17580 [Pseudonocardia saturnea]
MTGVGHDALVAVTYLLDAGGAINRGGSSANTDRPRSAPRRRSGSLRHRRHRACCDAAEDLRGPGVHVRRADFTDTTSMRIADEHQRTEQYMHAGGVPSVMLRDGWCLENHLGRIPPMRRTGLFLGAAGTST